MTTYYVSSEIGSNNNAGTSATAPLASLQAAANLVKPGDTVEVMNGTYTTGGNGDVLDITTSGTASAPITFEAAPGQTPVINSSGSWNAINIEASNIVVSGFTVVGDAANYTLQSALAGYSAGNPSLDGNGISVNTPGNGVVPNHIIIENNTVYNEPGGGIGTGGADYVQILNNVVYDNAHWSAFGTSGISINVSANSDTNPGVHDVVSGNLVFGNSQLVPTTGTNTITDGEGIILDTNPGFVGEILVENNTVYSNGSSGIESFVTDNAVITGNTVYGNDTQNVMPAMYAQILINQSNNNTVTNNITTAPNTPPPSAPVISGDTVNYGNSVTLNGTAQAGSTITVFDNSKQLGTTVTTTSGAWAYTTGALANGSQSFTATATNSAGNVSSPSAALVTTLNAPVNLVANGNFATGDFTNWTLGGNYNAGQITIDPNAEGGSAYAAGLGSMGSDGTLSQTIATTAGQTYTLSFWLQNEGSGGNDFKAIWNGQTLLSLTNAAQSGYTEYTYSVTATSSQTTLEFSAANGPSQWDLDNILLTANGTTSSSPPPPPAAPVISTGVANSNETVTLTGTATAGSTVTVSDGGATALGTATATGGSWSFTTAAALAAGSYAFTATDTTSAGTSAASSAFDVTVTSSSPPPPPAAPVISTGVANSNETVTLTGTATAGSTVTVSDGGATALGTATATGGSWSFTTAAALAAGSYAFTATDTTSAGTSAASSPFDVTVTSPSPPPSAPTVSSIAESPANGDLGVGQTVTYTVDMSEKVMVSGTPQLTLNDGGTATYKSGSGTNTLTFVYTVAAGQNTPDLMVTQVNLNGGTISDGAGNAANLSLNGLAQGSPQIDTTPPAAPAISGDTVNVNTMTLNGTAEAGSTITVFDNSTQLGTTTTTTSGAWAYTTGALANGSQSFTATATDSAGNVSSPSSALVTTLNASVNLVANGNFATGNFTNWTRGGNYSAGQITIDPNAEGGSAYAAGLGSMGSDGTLSQTIATTAGQTYTLSFWLQNEGSGGNDFKAIWNGQTLLSLTNAAQSGYTEYTYSVTATSSTSTLEFSAANNPSQWDLDNISLAANGTTGSSPPPSAPAISAIVESPPSGTLGAGQTVTLTLDMSKNVTVNTASGKPTLTLNDGGTATYKSGSGTGALIFTYTVAAGQNTADLSVTKVNLNGATIQDGTGNAANLSLIGLTQTGPQIDTSAPVTVGAGAKLEIAGTDTGSVTFAASTGMLKLDTPSTFSGKIFNFTGNGTLSGSDQIDLTNINFNTVKDRYANGVLTVMDGTHTDKLNLNGSYTLANFSFASDGSGGTIVYDPPVSMPSSQDTPNATSTGTSGPPSIGTGKTLELTASDPGGAAFTGSAGTLILDGFAPAGHALDFTGPVTGFGGRNVIDLPGIAFDAQTTLGYSANNNQTGGTLSLADGTHSVNIALLGNYMASCFAAESDSHGGTMVVAGASQPSDQSQLSHPHHT